MDKYNHKLIEAKWQAVWEKEQTFVAREEVPNNHAYVLDMFPYPSAQGLHVGHPEGYTATDIYSRYLRMRGVNVLHPMGWDAFGLPAENYAIKTGVHPRELTWQNIDNFRRQIKALGFSYDWSREVNTADPSYYKWTQWLFLQLYKKGLAYRQEAPVNWCPSCQTVLANEQVIDGVCERCDSQVEQRQMAQWFFKTTAYASALLKDLDGLDWPQPILDMQRNWIGKSEGAEVEFRIQNSEFRIRVFTTRLDTIFGATYMVLAPEHPLVASLLENQESRIKNQEEVKKYIKTTSQRTELERKAEAKDKTGVRLEGVEAINPANQERIPVFIADYVLTSYGTGAIMAVPAHDARDFEFAKKFELSVKEVVVPTQKRTALILHGTGADSKKNWYQWLKTELEQRGYQVFVPDLPDSQMPDLDTWLKALEPYASSINENSIIIGHSLGGPTAIQFVQRLERSVGALVLVAPTCVGMDWTPINASHSSEQANCIRAITEAATDWRSVSKKIKHIVGLFSSNDPYIPVATGDLYERNLSGSYIVCENRGHFSEKNGEVTKLPEFFGLPYAEFFVDYGTLINSGEFNGLDSATAVKKIAAKIGAKLTTQYRLRDWLISRQRYWGAPIPIIYCAKCGELPAPAKDLPVELPVDVDFRPHGESPLARSESFHNVKCPKCGAPARRESDTMDTFVDSSWYFLRYVDPQNNQEAFDAKKVKQWLPVDLYVGGAEHAVMHLLYARFITKALKDLGHIGFSEPFLKLRNQGLILGEDGQKMSKSHGNVVNPDEVVVKYGADTLRLYEMFLGPLEDVKPWNTSSIIGLRRFLDRVWNFVSFPATTGNPEKQKALDSPDRHRGNDNGLNAMVARTIKKVTEDIESFRFNTAIASLMEFINVMSSVQKSDGAVSTLLILLYPFAPHITSELWEQRGFKGYIWEQSWPGYDKSALKSDTISITVQVNGKVRSSIQVAARAKEDEIVKAARADVNVARHLAGKTIVRQVYVPGRLVNFVVE
ncbi:MAG: leucine--tRNA ligase [Candidatus Kerfeldbacteria bacterium]|nr:leucine--tRNA ligase [Candidatus Kerfeldbacteria bacterium]